MAKPVAKNPQEKRRENNQKIIASREAEVNKMRQESKQKFNLAETLTQALETLSGYIFGNKMGGDRAPDTAQKTLPYLQMFKDGLCRVTDNFYSYTIAFEDINYKLASDDSKNSIFNRYCSWLNSMQTDVKIQLTFHNTLIDLEALQDSVRIKKRGNHLDEVRQGYSEYIDEELSHGQNEIRRTKYITFGVNAENQKIARKRLSQVREDILKHFRKSLKCQAKQINGKQRIEMLHELLRDNPKDLLNYDFKEQAHAGLNSKDAIAPSGFDFRHSKIFGVGDRWARASFFQIQASQLYDDALSDLLDTDGSSLISLHIEIVDHEKAIKQVKGAITTLGAMKVEHNKKANREGYGMDILPPDLETYEHETAEYLENLEQKDERMFLITFTVINFSNTKSELENQINQMGSTARRHGLPMKTLAYKQEQGFQSALPFAHNIIEIQRGITTTGVGILVPFNIADVNMGRGSMCYGFNMVSKRVLLINRSAMTNPNSVIVGIPGSGKSMSAKMEMTLVMLMFDDDVIIVDPEGEYQPLVKKLGGEVVKLAPHSKYHINPLEINMNYGSDDSENTEYVNPVYFKTDLIMSLFEIIMEGSLNPVERSVIDQCSREVYKPYLENPIPENIPILEDMYNYLKTQEIPEAKHVAAALEMYVHGTLNYFNHRTNIDINNRMICFDIKELQKQLRDMGMLILQDQVWNRVTQNRQKKKKTWYFVDEFHLLLRTEQTRAYMVEIWKRFRKWGGLPTALTQNVKDFMATDDAKNILDNSPFIRILEQSPSDASILGDYLDISDDQLEHVFSPEIGGGLIRISTTIIPYKNELPDDNILFKYITTKPEDIAS